MSGDARAFWIREPGCGEIRPSRLPEPGPGEVLVHTLHSGISRGTETLVFRGGVPADQRTVMRAPFQDGEFPGPVKYGYLSVGRVEGGDPALRGRTVFCLYPHQSAYVVPATAVCEVPPGVPARRAVLAGTVETAVNALWDAAPLIGDRVVVLGAGMVGCAIARLLAGIPGAAVTLVDTNTSRVTVADRLGVPFADPDHLPGGCDVAVHTSGSAAGLQAAIDALGPEGRVIELSWYGDRPVTVSLGGRFHSSRLGIVASQVGTVAPARSARRSTRQRLSLALDLLQDSAFDALLSGSSPFEELPDVLRRLADGSLPALCHTIDYSERG